MKTKILMAFLLITLWGCEKEPVQPDPIIVGPPVLKKFATVVASANTGGAIDPVGETKLELGSTKIYKFIPSKDHLTYKVKVDGVDKIFSDNTFSLSADKEGVVKLEVEFLYENEVLIQERSPFYMSRINIVQGGVIVDWSFDFNNDKEKSGKLIFSNGHCLSSFNGKTYQNDYVFKDNTHFMVGDQNYEISLFTEDKLVYGVAGFYSFKPATYEYVYFK